MGKPSFKDNIKDIAYKIVLPIYLWSIGQKTLDDYISKIIAEEEIVGEKRFTINRLINELQTSHFRQTTDITSTIKILEYLKTYL